MSHIHSVHTHPISLRSILILYSHLRLGLPGGLFPAGFPTKILYNFHLSHACYMPFHLIFLDLITFASVAFIHYVLVC